MRQGVHLSREDSGRKHLNSEEVRRGFLRPSLEETLAFERSRSVGEQKLAEVVGSCQIWFLMSFFCLSFIFLLFYTYICFCFFLLPSEGVPTWTLPLVRGMWHQDHRREWKPSKRLYGSWAWDMYSALD